MENPNPKLDGLNISLDHVDLNYGKSLNIDKFRN